MDIKSSITDMPRNASLGEEDAFGIKPFENGLTQFILTSSTPITIALQGEWGSGKTSLMYSLKQNLCAQGNAPYHSVWLNTWEYSLMNDAQTTLLHIIMKLVQEVTGIADTTRKQTDKIMGKAAQLGKGLLRFGVKVAGDKVVEGAGDAITSQLFSEVGDATVLEIRNELEDIIQECIEKHHKKGIVFFIDDLDRIDPPVAVNLLELLKNVFTIKNCVFILAIDYDVVVKGLEPKFGALSEANEREFRSFFDKIIQVPFSMPVSNYDVADFLKKGLVNTGYISQQQAMQGELVDSFSNITALTVGSNPRSLKRLLNSLSLIGCINRAKSEEAGLQDELDLIVNFALVSIQIAYPPVYSLLCAFPDFAKWDTGVALQNNLPDLTEKEIEKLNSSTEFDEDWEKILYRFCEGDPYLKQKALSISRLLNRLKSIISEKGEDIKNTIESVIFLSSVTSIDSIRQPELEFHAGSALKEIRTRLLAQLQDICPDRAMYLRPAGKRVQSNARFVFNEKGEQQIAVSLLREDEKITIEFTDYLWLLPIDTGDLIADIESRQCLEIFKAIAADYRKFVEKHAAAFVIDPLDGYVRRLEGAHVLVLSAKLELNAVEDITSEPVIAQCAVMVRDWMVLLDRLDAMASQLFVEE